MRRKRTPDKRIPATCRISDKPFMALEYMVRRGFGQTCSYRCAGRKTRQTVEERFWSKVDKTPGQGPDGKCWEYQGCRIGKGYGSFNPTRDKNKPAHVYAYELIYGPMPEGMQGCHTCDNPPCCNPKHVFPGTHKDNAQDREAKGRGGHLKRRGRPVNVGEANGNSKYSTRLVSEIKRRHLQRRVPAGNSSGSSDSIPSSRTRCQQQTMDAR